MDILACTISSQITSDQSVLITSVKNPRSSANRLRVLSQFQAASSYLLHFDLCILDNSILELLQALSMKGGILHRSLATLEVSSDECFGLRAVHGRSSCDKAKLSRITSIYHRSCLLNVQHSCSIPHITRVMLIMDVASRCSMSNARGRSPEPKSVPTRRRPVPATFCRPHPSLRGLGWTLMRCRRVMRSPSN